MGVSARPARTHLAGNLAGRRPHLAGVTRQVPRQPGPASDGCVTRGATYRGSMVRILGLVVAAIFIVFVAAAVVRTLFWLALIALIAVAAGVLLAGVRRTHGSARRAGRYPAGRRS